MLRKRRPLPLSGRTPLGETLEKSADPFEPAEVSSQHAQRNQTDPMEERRQVRTGLRDRAIIAEGTVGAFKPLSRYWQAMAPLRRLPLEPRCPVGRNAPHPRRPSGAADLSAGWGLPPCLATRVRRTSCKLRTWGGGWSADPASVSPPLSRRLSRKLLAPSRRQKAVPDAGVRQSGPTGRPFLRRACSGTSAAASQVIAPRRPRPSAVHAHARNFPSCASTHRDEACRDFVDSTIAAADEETPSRARRDRRDRHSDRSLDAHIPHKAGCDAGTVSRDPPTGCHSLGRVGCLDVRLAAARAAALLDASRTEVRPPVFDLRQQKSC